VVDQAVINDSDALDVTYSDNETAQIEPTVTVEELKDLFEKKEGFLSIEETKDVQRIIDKNETNSFPKVFKLLTSKCENNG
jgi:hypothetical protein